MTDEDWIEITPRLVHRPPEAGKVTIALSVPSVGTATVRMNLSRVIGQAVGWQAKDMVKVALSKDGKRLRVTKVPEPQKGAGFTIGLRDTTLTVTIRLHWLMPLREARPAEPVEHAIAGNALVLQMPEWAHAPAEAMPVMFAPPIVAAPPAAAEPPPVAAITFDKVPGAVAYEVTKGPAHAATPKPPATKKGVMAAIGQIGRKPAAPAALPPPPAVPVAEGKSPSALSAIAAADDDEKEGKDMLAKGRSVREVADWLGEDMAVVRDWKRQVDEAAERRAGSAAARR